MTAVGNTGEITMDSRDIAELTGKQHAHVIRDIEAQLGKIGDDSRFGAVYLAGNGEQRKCYKLPYRETMILVSGYSVELRAKVIDRWMELEKQKAGAFSIPKTYAEALRLAAEQADTIDKQTLRIEQDKPKVEFYDAVTGSSDTIDMKTVAKVLDMGIGRNKLFAVLRYHKILMRNNEPYQSYVDAKYFNVIISEYAVDGEVHINRKTVVTPLGVDFIRKRVLKSKEDGIFDSILAVEAKE
jgi:phage antirepressor YoqD-like protein